MSYLLSLQSFALSVNWDSSTDIPVTSSSYTASGNTISFTLNSVPSPDGLTVINNTGLSFIEGFFDNLAQGQPVIISHDGEVYNFVANYFGGTGNDLVLAWVGTRVVAWGNNSKGQLGDSTTTKNPTPLNVIATGVLSGKTVVAVASGGEHSLALCSDGTLASWGFNAHGQLGDATTTQRMEPVAVNTSEGSALFGKTVIAVSAGVNYNLALCSDGTLASWGQNDFSQLGDGSTTERSSLPVAVFRGAGSALSGKKVVAISAGHNHSLALCSDGSVVAWGRNYSGQVGTNPTPQVPIPVAVENGSGSALFGKTVVAVSARYYNSVALCSDGTIAGWGNVNSFSFSANDGREVPVVLGAGSGSALLGKQVVAVSAGGNHQLFLCSDGTVVARGDNDRGQLGDGTESSSLLPVAVDTGVGSALFGKTVVAVSANLSSSLALCSDGTMAAWGFNVLGQLGDGTVTDKMLPVLVDRTVALPSERFSGMSGLNHSLALVTPSVAPPTPICTTSAISSLTRTSVQLNGSVNAQGYDTKVSFKYGSDGITFPNSIDVTPPGLNGLSDVSVTTELTGLEDGATYYYVLSASNQGGTSVSATQNFTTRTEPTASLGTQTTLTNTSVEVTGIINARGSDTQVFIDYGTNEESLPTSIEATPALATGYDDTPVSAVLTNLPQGTVYYRIRGTNLGGVGTSVTGSFQVEILSGFTRVLPSTPSSAFGFVFVNLTPSGIASGWRFVGEQAWRASGFPASSLTTADREIEYRPVPGFIQPLRETISVISGGAATVVSRQYFESAGGAAGSLSMILKPEALSNPSVDVDQRAQWRFIGEDDTQWRDSEAVATGLLPGGYLIECKPIPGRSTPIPISVTVEENQASFATATYFLDDAPVGTQPSIVPFEVVNGGSNLPYAFVGQLRSNTGSSTGFVVNSRVVATAGHVVFDDGTLTAVTGLQWLFQRDSSVFEPKPQIPRGFYIFDGYAAQRASENTPGESSPASQNLDAAALYFSEDAGRGGYGGFLASDSTLNEFLLSNELKTLAGYPVDGISAANQGRMHATPVTNVSFSTAFGRTYTTTDIASVGGNSGGPLCIQAENGNYYPAAIYLGGTAQTVVRAIDSEVIDLFLRAEVSGNGGGNNTGGGISHSSFVGNLNPTQVGALKVIIEPQGARDAGALWRLAPETILRAGNDFTQKSGLAPGTYSIEFTTATGFLTPSPQSVTVTGGQLTTITFTYQDESSSSPLESWRQLHFGSGATDTGDAADGEDPDKDGVKNIDEFIAGTDPKNAGDFLKIATATKSGTTFSVGCAGKGGRSYTLLRNTGLSGIWTSITSQGPLTSDGPVSLTDTSASAVTSFYRIEVSFP